MKISKSLKIRGTFGTVKLAWYRLVRRGELPGYLLTRQFDLERFDREHGVETAGVVELSDLKIVSPFRDHGERYGGVTDWAFHEFMKFVPIDHPNYTFIDFGSGKGAGILHASEYAFKRIIGVEFAPQLHEIALRNVAKYSSRTQKCKAIELVCMDATQFTIPDGPWLLFFNSPFRVPVWEPILKHIRKAPWGAGTSYLIYSNWGWDMETSNFVENSNFLRCVHQNEAVKVYALVA